MKKISWVLIAFAGWINTTPLQATQVQVWHEYKSGAPNSVRAEGVLQAPPQEIWETLIRLNDYEKFMPRVQASFAIDPEGIEALKRATTTNANLIKKIAARYKTTPVRKKGKKWEVDVFMVLNTPFPVANRWYVVHMIHDETQASAQHFARCWALVVGNIDQSNGCWILTPDQHSSSTAASYRDSVNPGGHVPQWAAKMGATETVPEMFERLEAETKRGK